MTTLINNRLSERDYHGAFTKRVGIEVEIATNTLYTKQIDISMFRNIHRDSSVSGKSSMEVVSFPLVETDIDNYVDIMEPLMKLNNNTLMHTAGIHLHFNLDWFSDSQHIFRLFYLACAHVNKLERLGTRGAGAHNYPITEHILNRLDPHNYNGSSGRNMLRLPTDKTTVEFRFFATSKKSVDIKNAFEICKHLISYTKTHDLWEIDTLKGFQDGAPSILKQRVKQQVKQRAKQRAKQPMA